MRNLTNEQLANERTLLAWIRTGIAVTAFGFVVVKFSLFVKQMTLLVHQAATIKSPGYSGPIGVFLVILGGLCMLFGALRYYDTERQLKTDNYRPRSGWLYALVSLLILVAVILAIYLLKTS